MDTDTLLEIRAINPSIFDAPGTILKFKAGDDVVTIHTLGNGQIDLVRQFQGGTGNYGPLTLDRAAETLVMRTEICPILVELARRYRDYCVHRPDTDSIRNITPRAVAAF